MHPPLPSAQPAGLSLVAFLVVVAAVVVAFIAAVGRTASPHRRQRAAWIAALGALAWLGISGGLAASGVLSRSFPAPYLGGCLVGAVALACSPVGGRLAQHLSWGALVGFQAFRLPLEGVLHAWWGAGVVPQAMTWSGQNFDVVTGLAALTLAPFARRARWAVIAFEIMGLAMLINIARIVARHTVGSPLYVPDAGPAIELAAHWPTTWIVSVCVAGACAGHFILARKLWVRPS